MTTTHARLAILVALAAAGCDTQPKRPLAVPVETGTPAAPAVILGAKPAKTDAAAEALIARMIAAHTNNDPAKLVPLKSHTMTRKGTFAVPTPAGGFAWTDTTWAVNAVWPDRYRVRIEMPMRSPAPDFLVLNGPTGWKLFGSQGQTDPAAFDALDRSVMTTETYAEWLVTLVPLIDATARVAAPVPGTPEAVRVWVADFPAAVLHTDPKSALLARIECQVNEPGGLVPRSLALSEFRPTNGVLLPTKLEYDQNGRPIAKWASSALEFPKDTPAEKFQKP